MVRRQLGSHLFGYTWVAELQKRGEVHYHVMLWVEHGYKIKKPDTRGGGWTHGMSRIERVRSPFYIVKYAKKISQKRDAYPHRCRMYAVSIRAELVGVHDGLALRVAAAPAPVRTFVDSVGGDLPGVRWKRLRAGWHVQWDNGFFILKRSGWAYVSSVATEQYAGLLVGRMRVDTL